MCWAQGRVKFLGTMVSHTDPMKSSSGGFLREEMGAAGCSIVWYRCHWLGLSQKARLVLNSSVPLWEAVHVTSASNGNREEPRETMPQAPGPNLFSPIYSNKICWHHSHWDGYGTLSTTSPHCIVITNCDYFKQLQLFILLCGNDFRTAVFSRLPTSLG